MGHSALAMTTDGTPLGLLDVEIWGASEGKEAEIAACSWTKESGKWRAGLEGVKDHLPENVSAVLIQDREGDFYDFLAAPRPERIELLVRAASSRKVSREGCAERETLIKAAAAGKVLGELRVQTPCDDPKLQSILPRQREAVLEVRVTEVVMRRPSGSKVEAKEMTVWVVQALEVDPPKGEKGLSWTLITTLTVSNLEEACVVVGYYARRWVIERLHYTLKSGMKAERLQIDDARSLSRCLAIYYVIAWRLLHMTYLAREDPDRPAAEILSADELAVLEAVGKKPVKTAAEAIVAIAKLGGYEYYRTAPPPGVKRIWMGWQRLTPMVEGWRAHRDLAGNL